MPNVPVSTYRIVSGNGITQYVPEKNDSGEVVGSRAVAYKVGDEIELTDAEAKALGEQVVPASQPKPSSPSPAPKPSTVPEWLRRKSDSDAGEDEDEGADESKGES